MFQPFDILSELASSQPFVAEKFYSLHGWQGYWYKNKKQNHTSFVRSINHPYDCSGAGSTIHRVEGCRKACLKYLSAVG